jgi:uncharacterized membrane protein YjdF
LASGESIGFCHCVCAGGDIPQISILQCFLSLYVLITLFVALHAAGAHYTYSEMPLGNWLRDALFLARNHYDRVVHFAFGLLIAFPLREGDGVERTLRITRSHRGLCG